MNHCKNVTLRGYAHSGGADNQTNSVTIVCEGNFTGLQAIYLLYSHLVVIESVAFTQCVERASLTSSYTNNVVLRNVSVSESHFGLELSSSRNLSVTFSTIKYCHFGIVAVGLFEFELTHSQLVNSSHENFVAILVSGKVNFRNVYIRGGEFGVFFVVT